MGSSSSERAQHTWRIWMQTGCHISTFQSHFGRFSSSGYGCTKIIRFSLATSAWRRRLRDYVTSGCKWLSPRTKKCLKFVTFDGIATCHYRQPYFLSASSNFTVLLSSIIMTSGLPSAGFHVKAALVWCPFLLFSVTCFPVYKWLYFTCYRSAQRHRPDLCWWTDWQHAFNKTHTLQQNR